MDRTTASRELARVFAYLACGKQHAARQSALALIEWLQEVARG